MTEPTREECIEWLESHIDCGGVMPRYTQVATNAEYRRAILSLLRGDTREGGLREHDKFDFVAVDVLILRAAEVSRRLGDALIADAYDSMRKRFQDRANAALAPASVTP